MKQNKDGIIWPGKFFRYIWLGIGLTFMVQLIIVLDRIIAEKNKCIEYNPVKDTSIIQNIKAENLERLLEGAGIPILVILLLGCSLIPIYLYLRLYIGTKSIYLMLRLPQKRSVFFFHHVKDTIKILVIVWMIQVLLLLMYFSVYQIAIPDQCKNPDLWKTFWRCDQIRYFYPILDLLEMIRPVICLIMLPSLFLLLIIVLLSQKKIFGLGIGILGVFSLCYGISMTTFSIFLEVLACFLVIGTGVYYLKHVAIT